MMCVPIRTRAGRTRAAACGCRSSPSGAPSSPARRSGPAPSRTTSPRCRSRGARCGSAALVRRVAGPSRRRRLLGGPPPRLSADRGPRVHRPRVLRRLLVGDRAADHRPRCRGGVRSMGAHAVGHPARRRRAGPRGRPEGCWSASWRSSTACSAVLSDNRALTIKQVSYFVVGCRLAGGPHVAAAPSPRAVDGDERRERQLAPRRRRARARRRRGRAARRAGGRAAGAVPRDPVDHQDEAGSEDRRDVLCYTSEVLAEPLDLAGSPAVRLLVSCDRPTHDLVVTLVMVSPGRLGTRAHRGRSAVPGGRAGCGVRARRSSYARSGGAGPAGAQLRLDVSGARFPAFDRNPHTRRSRRRWPAPKTRPWRRCTVLARPTRPPDRRRRRAIRSRLAGSSRRRAIVQTSPATRRVPVRRGRDGRRRRRSARTDRPAVHAEADVARRLADARHGRRRRRSSGSTRSG